MNMAAKSKKSAAKTPDNTPAPEIVSIKGFKSDLTCRGFQFEAGKTYEVSGDIKACSRGFHACPVEHHPLSVFEFYPPAGSRFFEVRQSGVTSAEDTKLASAKITIDVELSLGDLTHRAVKWVFDRVNWLAAEKATGRNEGATASGTRGAATASGYQGAATASGDQGAATASGTQGAATASGYQGAATASGTRGAATASGKWAVAAALGIDGKAKADETGAIVLAERVNDFGPEHGKLLNVWAGIVGRDGIKPNTFYTLRNGLPVEVAA